MSHVASSSRSTRRAAGGAVPVPARFGAALPAAVLCAVALLSGGEPAAARTSGAPRAGAPAAAASAPAPSAQGPQTGSTRSALPPPGYLKAEPICGSIDVYHERNGERLAAEIGRIACSCASSIAEELGLERIEPVVIIISRDTEGFSRLHGGRLPEWGEAFAEMGRGLIGIDASRVIASPRPLRTVVAHELSHLLFDQRVGGADAPAWLIEGIAMRQSGEWTFDDEWNLARSVWSEDLPDLSDLEGAFPRPTGKAETAYRLSHSAVDFLLAGNPGALVTLTAFLRDTGDFERAFLLTFGETQGEFAGRFLTRLEDRYRSAGAILDASPYWLSLAGLFLLVYMLKRRRTSRKIAEWERGDGPAVGGRPRRRYPPGGGGEGRDASPHGEDGAPPASGGSAGPHP